MPWVPAWDLISWRALCVPWWSSCLPWGVFCVPWVPFAVGRLYGRLCVPWAFCVSRSARGLPWACCMPWAYSVSMGGACRLCLRTLSRGGAFLLCVHCPGSARRVLSVSCPGSARRLSVVRCPGFPRGVSCDALRAFWWRVLCSCSASSAGILYSWSAGSIGRRWSVSDRGRIVSAGGFRLGQLVSVPAACLVRI